MSLHARRTQSIRQLVVTENVTLDGVIDASEGWFSPAGDEEVDRSDITEALREQAAAADVLDTVQVHLGSGCWHPGDPLR
jgi:hypothetical protein